MGKTGRMDFETGKLHAVARHLWPNQRREYLVLWSILVVTSTPYVFCLCFWPIATTCLVLFIAYLQVLIAFATSTGTDTAHHIRFLLSGSNPIGMTGSSSLLFGAVDSVFDWKEDKAERRRNPTKFWLLLAHKFAMTPIGLVLMVSEYAWDAVLMRRPALVQTKWHELFSMADFHQLVCPEKSNDIFYADLAFARFQNDPYLYQWNRMRAMVFELKHHQIDAQNGSGVAKTNVFTQDDVTAYQTLKRLELETIEESLERHYTEHIQDFPFPPTLGSALIKNAQPIRHYLQMKQELRLGRVHQTEISREFSELLHEGQDGRRGWQVLRLLDENSDRLAESVSRHISRTDLEQLANQNILRQATEAEFEFTDAFRRQFESFLARHFQPAPEAECREALLQQTPTVLMYRGLGHLPVHRPRP